MKFAPAKQVYTTDAQLTRKHQPAARKGGTVAALRKELERISKVAAAAAAQPMKTSDYLLMQVDTLQSAFLTLADAVVSELDEAKADASKYKEDREEWLHSIRLLHQNVTDKLLDFEKGQVRIFAELASAKSEMQVCLAQEVNQLSSRVASLDKQLFEVKCDLQMTRNQLASVEVMAARDTGSAVLAQKLADKRAMEAAVEEAVRGSAPAVVARAIEAAVPAAVSSQVAAVVREVVDRRLSGAKASHSSFFQQSVHQQSTTGPGGPAAAAGSSLYGSSGGGIGAGLGAGGGSDGGAGGGLRGGGVVGSNGGGSGSGRVEVLAAKVATIEQDVGTLADELGEMVSRTKGVEASTSRMEARVSSLERQQQQQHAAEAAAASATTITNAFSPRSGGGAGGAAAHSTTLLPALQERVEALAQQHARYSRSMEDVVKALVDDAARLARSLRSQDVAVSQQRLALNETRDGLVRCAAVFAQVLNIPSPVPLGTMAAVPPLPATPTSAGPSPSSMMSPGSSTWGPSPI